MNINEKKLWKYQSGETDSKDWKMLENKIENDNKVKCIKCIKCYEKGEHITNIRKDENCETIKNIWNK